jgi:hypothetical protein
MKKKIAILFLVIATSIFLMDLNSRDVHSNNSGAPAGKTGSPGDNSSCRSCHNINTSPQLGILFITSNVPNSGYISGNTYTITVTAGHPTISKFGFQASPQSTNGDLKGSLTVTDNTQMQLVGSGKYITHKSGAGTQGTNIGIGFSKQWQFNWTAPSPGSGDVTIYAACLMANNNAQSSGDSTALATLLIPESSTNGIINLSKSNEVKLFPNPASSFINLVIPENSEVSLININGKIVLQQNVNSGLNTLDVSNLPAGIYFAKLQGENINQIIKFVKQ